MAGKNDCGMAGKGWREMGGGKRVAGNGWREIVGANIWRERVLHHRRARFLHRRRARVLHRRRARVLHRSRMTMMTSCSFYVVCCEFSYVPFNLDVLLSSCL